MFWIESLSVRTRRTPLRDSTFGETRSGLLARTFVVLVISIFTLSQKSHVPYRRINILGMRKLGIIYLFFLIKVRIGFPLLPLLLIDFFSYITNFEDSSIFINDFDFIVLLQDFTSMSNANFTS